MEKVIIETERLIIRELEDSDCKGIFRLDSNPEVHRYLGGKPLTTEKQASEVIAFIRKQYQEHGIGRWAVIQKESNEFIGWSGFKLIKVMTNNHIDYLDIGYRFVQEAWGQGYATESGKACLQYAKTNLTHYPIHAISDINNLDSKKVLEKLGFEAKEIFDYENQLHFWYHLR
ncbi:GNAT family N-acetyltransferase [Sphingobacterium spiritivorum]|uniref:GNAT family N-acetyltransferase n=1 Tax=Sphingobacterium TaxID=28453 RepID=UPI001918582C|nr:MULTISPECIES: GNAT family N-acetyltransferase [Sphingobacterium]QQT24623.1 GNAT family N-acetyltransferase [Sphingobacterium spiritivorum]